MSQGHIERLQVESESMGWDLAFIRSKVGCLEFCGSYWWNLKHESGNWTQQVIKWSTVQVTQDSLKEELSGWGGWAFNLVIADYMCILGWMSSNWIQDNIDAYVTEKRIVKAVVLITAASSSCKILDVLATSRLCALHAEGRPSGCWFLPCGLEPLSEQQARESTILVWFLLLRVILLCSLTSQSFIYLVHFSSI